MNRARKRGASGIGEHDMTANKGPHTLCLGAVDIPTEAACFFEGKAWQVVVWATPCIQMKAKLTFNPRLIHSRERKGGDDCPHIVEDCAGCFWRTHNSPQPPFRSLECINLGLKVALAFIWRQVAMSSLILYLGKRAYFDIFSVGVQA